MQSTQDIARQKYRLARLVSVIEDYKHLDKDVTDMALAEACRVKTSLIMAELRKGSH